MSDTDTRAALDAAIEQYRTAPMGSSDRTAVDRAIAAHVEAEVARRLEAAPEVETAIADWLPVVSLRTNSDFEAANREADPLRAAIAADKARAVEAAHAEADQLSHFANEVIRRVGARERGAGGQTAESGTTRLLADAGRRIDAMVARDKARPTPDEARRLVDALWRALAGDVSIPPRHGKAAAITARTALLRALGVEP